MSEKPFIPGRELSARFYAEAVAPVLSGEFPSVAHSAALVGPGSDVLGFDTPMSMDHDWGPRVQLFVEADVLESCGTALRKVLDERLPRTFAGHPVFLSRRKNGSAVPVHGEHHLVEVTTLGRFLFETLGFEIDRDPSPAEWLVCPSQRLRSVAEATIHFDGLGIASAFSRFAWYPHDVWLYLLASAWTRIGQEEHVSGRAGYVGDELGARLIASRLVRDVMRICFLLERQFAPYPKWFGTAFRRLDASKELTPVLELVLDAKTWVERDKQLALAYAIIGDLQNRAGICETRPSRPGPFYDRPFQVIELHSQFAPSLLSRITDPRVVELSRRRPIGSIDLFSDSTDLHEDGSRRVDLLKLFSG